MKEKGTIDMLKQTIILSRQQLYDEIWQISVAGVARKYNLNYAKLIAKCRETNIPFPSSGYWTKKSMGKDLSEEAIALPPSDIEKVELLLADVKVGRKRTVDVKKDFKKELDEETTEKLEEIVPVMEKSVGEILGENVLQTHLDLEEELLDNAAILPFLESEERRRVLKVISEIAVSEKRRLHGQLVKYRNAMDEWKRKEKEVQNRYDYDYNSRYNKPENKPTFFDEIAVESQKRVFLILDAIFRAVERLGGKVNSDLSIRVKEDIVRIRIAEGKDKVKHELTKQEAREMVEYNERVKKYSWTSKPNIRKYDYVYNGRMRIVFSDGEYIRDNNTEKLEDRLGDILIRLYEKSEEARIEREKREEERRKREEEARLWEEACRRKEDEIKKTKALLNQVEDYKIACEIRQYIAAIVQKKKMGPELAEWVEWAKKKADWFDPTVALEDEYLGKREHAKSKDEKDLDKSYGNRYRSIFW